MSALVVPVAVATVCSYSSGMADYPRSFRVDPELWDAAVKLAKQRGETVGEILREALRRYVKRGMK